MYDCFTQPLNSDQSHMYWAYYIDIVYLERKLNMLLQFRETIAHTDILAKLCSILRE
jgi:hypothetical protein